MSDEMEETMNDIIAKRNGAPPEFTLNDFEVGKPLGRGKFGRVYVAREKQTKYVIALKILYKSEIINYSMDHQVQRELEIQSRLDHPNVLKFYNYFHDSTRIFLILEYAGKGELYTILQNQPEKRFSDRTSARYLMQIMEGLRYLHEKNVIHRDIKPENLLIDYDDNVKIADFGWSVHAPSNKRKTMCGTLDYLPPEMVNRLPYSDKVDLWCLGILCYEFLVGNPPFESDETRKTYDRILGLQISYPKFLCAEVKDLINRFLKLDPNQRITIQQARQHPWIVKNTK